MKKLIYIAHPISGDVVANLEDIRRIVKYINRNFPDVVPCVPYYADCVSLDDSIASDRKRGIKNDIAIINTGIFDELWLTGDKISFGMQEEVKLFILLGKEVINLIGKI